MNRKLKEHPSVRFLEAFVLLHLIWLIGARLLEHRTLPSPVEVYAALFDMMGQKMLWMHTGASLSRLLPALAISLVLAVLYVFSTYFLQRTQKVSDTMIYFAYPIPKMILLPVIMVLFGLGNGAKIGMIVCVILLQMIVQLRDALKQVDPSYVDVVVSLRGGKWSLVQHVLFPAILPTIFSALRLSIGTSVSVLFVTETYGTYRGLGYLVVDQWMRLDYVSMYATILLLGGLGFLLFVLVDVVEYLGWGKRFRQ